MLIHISLPHGFLAISHCYMDPNPYLTALFSVGGHLLAFLTCLENGLAPKLQLDPPLWNQNGKGKVFPKLKKR